jgi:hypothetical protein
MKFLRNNWIALTILFLLLFNEIGHLAFKGIPFNHRYELDTPVYYFSLAIRNVVFSILVFILIPTSNKPSRALMAGAITWNLIELYQEFCYIAKINTVVFFVTDGLYGQLVFICCVILLIYYGSQKYKY